MIAFRAIPHSIFGASAGPITPNKLVLRLQPDEGVKLWLMIKYPGPGGLRLRCVPLDMSFAEAFGVRYPDAYERLLMDVVRGNQTLFMRRDEVEAAWKWIDPILAAWRGGRQRTETVHRRQLGAERRRRADRTRRPHMARGMTMRVPTIDCTFANDAALAESFAETVAANLRAAIDARGRALIGLSGGSTPREFLKRLSNQRTGLEPRHRHACATIAGCRRRASVPTNICCAKRCCATRLRRRRSCRCTSTRPIRNRRCRKCSRMSRNCSCRSM